MKRKISQGEEGVEEEGYEKELLQLFSEDDEVTNKTYMHISTTLNLVVLRFILHVD